jgi:DNA-binding HxlR family transcriptional regulator
VARNVRTYEHFCVLARALERIGERWTLLVVRDLLTGPKRFTDLMDRLGGITPKTLTQRLRELEEGGIVAADREPGRREVRYRLTAAGEDLAPAVEALGWWGVRHAWRPPAPGDPIHVEHLLAAVVRVIDRTGGDPSPARWHLALEDAGDYAIESDGSHWTLANRRPEGASDVTVTTTSARLRGLIADPTPERASALGIRIDGVPAEVERFHELLGTFPREVPLRAPAM